MAKSQNFGCKFDVFDIYICTKVLAQGGYGRRMGDFCSLVNFLLKAIKLQKFKLVTPKSSIRLLSLSHSPRFSPCEFSGV